MSLRCSALRRCLSFVAARLACVPVIILFRVAPLPAGEEISGTPSDDRPGVVEEVMVTAQRREENLMSVPLAVTALSGESLDELGALDLRYLSQVTPNTTVEIARGTNNAIAAYIRGVGQQDHIAGFESGVGLYVDDVYFNRPQLALLDVYDVARIEVLRGPQGTLYGRNTIGGAIRYVTRRLGDEPELRLLSRVGNYAMRDVILVGSLPLGDSLRFGASFASLNLDGFGENLYLKGEKNYGKDMKAARISTEWQPADAWFVRLAGDWLQDDSDLRRGHRTRVGRLSGAPVLDDVFDSRAGNAFPVADAEAKGVSLTAEWRASDSLRFRGILASRHDETWKPVDLDGLPTVDVDVNTWDENRQKTAEFQVLFSRGKCEAVAGVFAIDASAATVLGVVLGATGNLIGRPGLANELTSDVDTESWAAFADVSMAFNARWSASLGGRYTYDKRSAFVGRRVMVGGVSPFFGGPAVTVATTSDFEDSEVFEKITPRATLQWRPRDDHHVYLSYSEGFKGGGFDPRGLSTLAPDFDRDGVVSAAEVHQFMKFDPEELHSWEIGWKSVLLNGRVTSRLALFVADYTDVQIPGSVSVDEDEDGLADTWVGITTNAASAGFEGLEWEGQALLARDLGVPGGRLELSSSLGYIDAEFHEWVNSVGEDVADDRAFANTPKWTAGASASYGIPLGWFGRSDRLTVITTLSYRDDETQFEAPIPEFDQRGFTLWDMSVIWSPANERWRLGLYGKNLTDERYTVAGLNITLGLEDNYTLYYGNPRQYWLELQYRFN